MDQGNLAEMVLLDLKGKLRQWHSLHHDLVAGKKRSVKRVIELEMEVYSHFFKCNKLSLHLG
jgi:hypothetical protein